jgi:hypothetical protein
MKTYHSKKQGYRLQLTNKTTKPLFLIFKDNGGFHKGECSVLKNDLP